MWLSVETSNRAPNKADARSAVLRIHSYLDCYELKESNGVSGLNDPVKRHIIGTGNPVLDWVLDLANLLKSKANLFSAVYDCGSSFG